MQRQTFTFFAVLVFLNLATGNAFGQLQKSLDLVGRLGLVPDKMKRSNHQGTLLKAPAAKLNVAQLQAGVQNVISVPRKEVEYEWEPTSETTGAWEEIATHTNTYSNQAQVQERISDFTDQAEPDGRETFTYNSQGRPAVQLRQVRQGQNWVDVERDRYSYNPLLGGLEEFVTEEWNNGAWEITEGTKRTFTLAGAAISELIVQEYTPGTGWVNASKALLSYENNQVNTWTTQEWENNQWVNSERYTNIVWRDWTGLLQSVVASNDLSSDLFSYITYATSATTQTWDPEAGTWVIESRFTNTFAPGNATILFESPEEGNTWSAIARLVITSDERGNLTSIKSEVRDEENWTQASEFRFTYTYDGINLTEVVSQLLFPPLVPELTNVSRSVFSEFQTFNLTATPDPLLNAQTKIYPNPVSRDLHLELPELSLRGAHVSLYSVTGQKVYERTEKEAWAGTITIDLASLPQGVYLLRLITADNKALTRRVVRQ